MERTYIVLYKIEVQELRNRHKTKFNAKSRNYTDRQCLCDFADIPNRKVATLHSAWYRITSKEHRSGL